MNSKQSRPGELETLSALHDGEVSGEARLFALRRLGHDPQWQRACGQWQLIGDVLRRQAPIAAPDDFADRVTAAIAAEQAVAPVTVAVAPTVSRRGRRVRWIGGGALAASVALAVAVSSIPFGDAPAPVSSPVVASAGPSRSAGSPAEVALQAQEAAPVQVASVPEAVSIEPAATGSATAPAARTAPAERVAAAPARREVRANRAPAASTSGLEGFATALIPEEGANPFNLPAGQALTARPWPRAALGGASAGAFTARYAGTGESDAGRPSFHPFEPRPPGDAEQAPSP